MSSVPPTVLERSMPLTMAPETDVRFTAEQALAVIERDIPGVLVECGVWRGGCSAAMLLAQVAAHGEAPRRAFLLDSFEGLPPATDRDGPMALAYQADTDSPTYFDNCRADIGGVRAAMLDLDLPADSWELVPGWFADTAPVLAARLEGEQIAVLRLDGDWYESTMTCLEHLMPLVAEEGVVIIDDYYAWDGCARAVHDYLSREDLPYRIRGIRDGVGAYMIKRAHRIDAL